MAEWPDVALGDLVDIKHGFAFQGEFFRDDPPGDVLITPGNFAVGGGFKGDKLKYYAGPVPEDYVLSAGDLIVTMTDLSKQGDTLGYPAIVPTSSGRFLHNQRIGKVLGVGERADTRFLYYLLCTREYRNEVLASATGTTVKHTAPSRIRAFRLALPPLTTQQGIAEVLRALDDKIELNRCMNQTLESMARATFRSWFMDFDPVVAKAACRQPFGMSTDVAALFPDGFVDSAIGAIPSGWSTRSFYECAHFVNGAPFNGSHFSPDRSGVPIVKIAELKYGITRQTQFTTQTHDKRYRLATGDVLFSWSGSPETSIGTFVWSGGPAWLNQHIFRVSANRTEDELWVYYGLFQLNDEFIEIARNKQTTGLGHVTVADLKRLLVVAPSDGALTAFNAVVGPVHRKWFQTILESRTLAALRDALLPKLMSGELRVRDAEKLAGIHV